MKVHLVDLITDGREISHHLLFDLAPTQRQVAPGTSALILQPSEPSVIGIRGEDLHTPIHELQQCRRGDTCPPGHSFRARLILGGSVERITDDRRAESGQVDAQLVGAARRRMQPQMGDARPKPGTSMRVSAFETAHNV